MEEKAYLFALAHAGLLPRTLFLLLEKFETGERLWRVSHHDLSATEEITPAAKKKFLRFRENFPLDKAWERFQKTGIDVVGMRERDYPGLLKTIADPPHLLFFQGDLSVLSKPCIAIVGSRNASPIGKLKASKIAETLAAIGFTIVSGLARGIDMAAHQGALESGTTAAVLGSGLDRVYPPENGNLAKRIAKSGVVLSEFPPGAEPLPWNFPRRNRIVSGLSTGIIVAEAGEKSGALITAQFALEQGREVFALPGGNDSSLKGTHALIQDGAKPVQEIADILEEFPYFDVSEASRRPLSGTPYRIRLRANRERARNTAPKALYFDVSEASRHRKEKEPLQGRASKEILEILKRQKKGSVLEELVRETKIPVKEIAGTLILLEAKGLVSRFPGNLYVKV